jgi:hypothetical protein
VDRIGNDATAAIGSLLDPAVDDDVREHFEETTRHRLLIEKLKNGGLRQTHLHAVAAVGLQAQLPARTNKPNMFRASARQPWIPMRYGRMRQ